MIGSRGSRVDKGARLKMDVYFALNSWEIWWLSAFGGSTPPPCTKALAKGNIRHIAFICQSFTENPDCLDCTELQIKKLGKNKFEKTAHGKNLKIIK